MSDELEKRNPSGCDARDPECDAPTDQDACVPAPVPAEDAQVEADAPAPVDGDAEGVPEDGDGAEEAGADDCPEDDHARRSRVQNRRAAIAVAIMVLISAVLIGGVKLMYFVAERVNEPAQVGTVVPGAIQRALEVKAEVEGTEPTEPFYVLLIGSDSRKGTALYTGKSDSHAQVDQHSDVMTLLRVDPVNYVLTFVTIPRDTQL